MSWNSNCAISITYIHKTSSFFLFCKHDRTFKTCTHSKSFLVCKVKALWNQNGHFRENWLWQSCKIWISAYCLKSNLCRSVFLMKLKLQIAYSDPSKCLDIQEKNTIKQNSFSQNKHFSLNVFFSQFRSQFSSSSHRIRTIFCQA